MSSAPDRRGQSPGPWDLYSTLLHVFVQRLPDARDTTDITPPLGSFQPGKCRLVKDT